MQLTESDFKNLAHMKNKKGEYLLDAYDIGYIVANLGHEQFQKLEEEFQKLEERRVKKQDAQHSFSYNSVQSERKA